MDLKQCVVCQSETDEKLFNVTPKGSATLIQYFKYFHPDRASTLEKSSNSAKIHRSCQKNATNDLSRKKKADDAQNAIAAKKAKVETRSSVSAFDWKVNCLYCGSPCIKVSHDPKHPDRADCHRGEYKVFRDVLLKKCKSLDNDDQAREIERRLLSCSDLIAAEGRYHENCRSTFNLKINNTYKEKGRPVSEHTQKTFEDLCEWLEGEGELHTLDELQEKLKEIAGSTEVYTTRTIQRKLQEKYGSNLCISTVEGRRNVVCLKNLASVLLNDMWYENRTKDIGKESDRIILMAAKLIIADIRTMEYDNEFYPTNEAIASEEDNLKWLAPKLKLFMESCVRVPLKQASIGQCLTHAVRPRTIPPILFGIATDIDHLFGSRHAIDQQHKFGFSLSSTEVTRFKQSVVMNDDANSWLKRNMKGAFHHWIADNVDHNFATLDGKGTLHAMGILVATTGARGSSKDLPKLVRQKISKVSEVMHKHKGIPMLAYIPPDTSGLSKIMLKPRSELSSGYDTSDLAKINLLWHSAFFFKKHRPGWSGYMSEVCPGLRPHDGKADFTYCPIIDLDPTDMSCIYSTLMFVLSQAKTLNVKTPCLTFDQPLWLKATEIVQALSLRMVLILGGFHTMMSFVGSIGNLMDGSGLTDCLQNVFASNSVPKIMDGKAISRALRGHFLIESSLCTILLSTFIPEKSLDEDNDLNGLEDTNNILDSGEGDSAEDNVELDGETVPDTFNDVNDLEEDFEPFIQSDVIFDLNHDGALRQLKEEEMKELRSIYECMEDDYEKGMERLNVSKSFTDLLKMFDQLKERLRLHSRTSKLWLYYMDCISIIKQFIRAERCGHWELHLDALDKMINLFAATGHLNYAKSARLHLQQMRELETTYPDVYHSFKNMGYHTVRRSDKYYAGLSTDLIIEQVLMRALKSSGGITRGRGRSEAARHIWLESMHRRAGIHDAISTLTNLKRTGGEQHVDLTTARRQIDMKDLSTITLWLKCHSPFDTTSKELRSIASGLTARDKDNINCDDAEDIGFKLQEKLDKVCFESVSMKRKEKIRTLALLQDTVKVQNESIVIDPLVLFGRLSLIAQNRDDAAAQFAYELAVEPTSLFKNGLMRKPTKSSLRKNLIKNKLDCKEPTHHTVIDGGALLFQVSWLPNSMYNDISNQYTDYILRKHGEGKTITVIFDGYDDPLSTKAHEHARRNGLSSADVNVQDDLLKVVSSRKLFLKNVNNKKELIRLLTLKFLQHGINVDQSQGDADVLTVKVALRISTTKQVKVVSDDTDILVLLMYHWQSRTMEDIILATTKTVSKKKIPIRYSIKELVEQHKQTEHLLFAHAWTGCDTTSAIHKYGKAKIFQLLKTKSDQVAISCFGDTTATQDSIGNAGINMFVRWLVVIISLFLLSCEVEGGGGRN